MSAIWDNSNYVSSMVVVGVLWKQMEKEKYCCCVFGDVARVQMTITV